MESKVSKVIEALRNCGFTVATAESCTGGLVSKTLTDVAGCSDVVLGGVVSYSNSVKTGILGVCKESLESFGAVSEETASEMALGACRVTGADVAVSTTGIAGPGGGSEAKPVGTVCFGICKKGEVKTYTKHFDKEASRDEIRHMALDFALELIWSVCK